MNGVVAIPSNQLEADLWMVQSPSSASLYVQEWIYDNGSVAAVIVVIVLSAMTGMIAWIVFGGHRPILCEFAVLGLACILTIFGLWLVAKKLEIERTMTRAEIPLSSKPYRSDFLFVYTFVFVISISSVLFVLWM